MARTGKIQPPAVKIGKAYYVDPMRGSLIRTAAPPS
jgi:hypothetical protein